MPKARLFFARQLYSSLLLGSLLLGLTGCWQQRSPADEQALRDAQATIDALAAENARLATQAALVAQPPPSAATAALVPTLPAVISPTAPAIPAPAAVVTAAVETPALGNTDTLFPAVIADLPLAADGQVLVDFRLDQAANHLYVADAAQLYVVDATSYEVLTTLPVGGHLTLDPAAPRLFVTPRRTTQESGAITVVDTEQLTMTGVISGATHLTFDADQSRIFVGHEQQWLDEKRGAPVQVLDAATLAPVAESPHFGVPVYNSLRDELLLVNSSVWVIDPTTWELRQDLLPEITRQECVNCNGALIATDALLFPAADVLALRIWRRTTGGGPGIPPAPQFLQASTLEPLADPALALQPTCGTQPLLRPTVNDHSYHTINFLRYVASYNLLVKDSAGNIQTWRDGISDLFLNANTAQAYANGLMLDLPALAPRGELPSLCFFAHDTARGLLYGARSGHLVVLAERGGLPAVRPNEDAILPDRAIHHIAASPAFPQDPRLFVLSSAALDPDELYRSNDGGQTWLRLRQGLPNLGGARLTLALSPAFATDQTLFLGGYWGDGRGLGVFRSTDGGDSWQPMWQGLTHLRVDDLLVSPNYPQDQTVLAFARYNWWTPPFTSGYSAQRSVDSGLSWTVVATTTTDTRPDPLGLLPGVTPTPVLPVRLGTAGQLLERTADNGQTWQTVELSAPTDNRGIALTETTDPQISYLLGSHGLWRVRNAGATIELWNDARLEGLTFTNTLTTLAISGEISAEAHRLFVGTTTGELWILDPAQMNWAIVVSETVTPVLPTATPLPPITPTISSAPQPTVADAPPAGLFAPQGIFATDWARDPAHQQALGWAKTEQAASTAAAQQTFDKGLMIWRGDDQAIYVLYSDNTWQRFPDTFQEGERESDPTLTVPDGKFQPIRGFGKIWREEAGVRDQLGWATAREQGFDATVQDFERGFLLRSGGLVYALIEQADGRQTWLVL